MTAVRRSGRRIDEVGLPEARDVYDDVRRHAARRGAVHAPRGRALPGRAAEYGADVRARLELAATRGHARLPPRRRGARSGSAAAFARVFPEVDLLLTPVWPAPRADRRRDGRTSRGADRVPRLVMSYTVPQDLAGLPACAVRAGFDELGIPVGVQLTGAPWEDARVLGAAQAFGGDPGGPGRWPDPSIAARASTHGGGPMLGRARYRCAVTHLGRLRRRDALEWNVQADTPSPLSRGDYDIRAGIPRILALLEKHDIPATFMVPGQVIDDHPARAATSRTSSRDRVPRLLPRERARAPDRGGARADAARDRPDRGGVRHAPRGNRSPPFALGPNTADLLEEFGFAYDSSLFGHDEPYRPRVPVPGGALRDLVELPVSWELDDAPYFLFNFFPYMSGYATPSQVLEIWKAEFDGSYAAGGCFLLVIHPFCIGRHPRIAMLDELLRTSRSFPDVWFATHLEVAEEWRRMQEEAGLWEGGGDTASS